MLPWRCANWLRFILIFVYGSTCRIGTLVALLGGLSACKIHVFPMFIAITIECGEYCCQPFFRVFAGCEDRRSGVKYVDCSDMPDFYGFVALASLLRAVGTAFRWREIIGKTAMKRFFQVNSDIFFRTLCLVAVTTFFYIDRCRQGDVVLAVNTLLMQLFTLFSYIMDGFAYAGEAMTGRYVGARNNTGLQRMIRLLFRWGWGLSLSFTILYMIGGQDFLGLLTNDTTVINAAGSYYYWVLAIPYWLCRFPLGWYPDWLQRLPG